jgi:hypothetical protein
MGSRSSPSSKRPAVRAAGVEHRDTVEPAFTALAQRVALRRKRYLAGREGADVAGERAALTWHRLRLLLVCAAALELVWLVGFLLPLSIWSNPKVVASPRVLAVVMGNGTLGALRFAVPVCVGFLVFACAVLAAKGLTGRVACAVVLGASALFCLTLLPTNPVTADDVYHNVADARTLWIHGANPAMVPPSRFKQDPFLKNVPAWRDTPSAYGPLWYLLSGAPLPFTGTSLWANVIAEKLIVSVFMAGTVALAMGCAAKLRPGSEVVAGVLFGWCPLTVWESAGAAHNDLVMVFFIVAALYALLRGGWPFVLPLLALAIAVKPTGALIAPLVLVWMLAQRRIPRSELAISLIASALIAGLLYLPFYSGPSALAGLGREAGHVSSSPGALIHTTIAIELHLNGTRLLAAMKFVVWPVFIAVYGWLCLRLARQPDQQRLVQSAFLAVFLFLVVLSWWFMSWYVLWLLPLAALLSGSRQAAIGVAFAAGAMLLNVPHFWLLGQNAILQEAAAAAVAFLPPLVVALAPGRRPRSRLPRPALPERSPRLAVR